MGMLAAVLASSALAGIWVTESATAHSCSQQTTDIEDHGGCDGHSCPVDTAPHSHTTNHLQSTLPHTCTADPNEQTTDCAYANPAGDAIIVANGLGGCIQNDVSGSVATISIVDVALSPASGLACWTTCSIAQQPICGTGQSPVVTSTLLVFVDGPVFGNPLLSPCGLAVSASLAGNIFTHTS